MYRESSPLIDQHLTIRLSEMTHPYTQLTNAGIKRRSKLTMLCLHQTKLRKIHHHHHHRHLRNDINLTPLCLSRNILHQNPCPILNRRIRRHRGRNHLDPFHGQGILDTVPILNGRQEGARQFEFGEP